MQKRWKIRKHDADAVNTLASQIGVKPLVAALLISRGHGTAERAFQFLNPSPEHLHEPFLMEGMSAAVVRVKRAVENREKVFIWGDLDVDGTTGTVLLRKTFGLLGIETNYHITNRFTENRGINFEPLAAARADGYTLLVSVDTGTSNFDEVSRAKEIGMDTIICDHHEIKADSILPPAVALINPFHPDSQYPDDNLAGVGVAFKFAHALLREFGLESEIPGLLKIAAIGTVADVVSLSGENRAIVALGLIDLAKTDNWGLKALMEVSDCRSDMTSMHIGFRIGPRINAAGRMEVGTHVVELLESDNFTDARRLAALLDSRNRERQKIQQEVTAKAIEEALTFPDSNFVVVGGEGWHKGVVGLAASRVAESFHRPTIVFSLEGDVATGSARSVKGFDLFEALGSVSDLLDSFGGHVAAAGMKAKEGNINELRARLDRYADETIPIDERTPELAIDALVKSSSLGLELVEDFSRFEPFGAGNPKPVFVTRDLILRDDPFVMKDKHLKLKLIGDDNRIFEAVWWDGVERSKGQTLKPDTRIELAYVAEANSWQGNTRLQLVVQDLRADN
ncbi:MAG: single-stranded-DNA-specific exonuclease RecJ [Pyrinomonadaceae bacterium]|nr:single-stranded-DNA-specific exonuclease RecJ [Acidobacteriota bacterium]MBK7935418.1 single-stranded-DNA-specific exonuclease RecJ [Acidobacteriota bacterium]MBP7375972.1 single-stranded-DNA-specific exonuclease RecJ [Pyrinomonadaceae bacterium]